MKITIFGGGWLGQPLAVALSKNSANANETAPEVQVTCRSEASMATIRAQGLQARQFILGGSLQDKAAGSPLLHSDIVVINIPPGRRNLANNPQASEQFVSDMSALIRQTCIEQSAKLIFISTSAVYGDVEGEITENSQLNPSTESARAHCAIEQFIQQNIPQAATILRLAGLVGPKRHPAKFLAGKLDLSGASQVVNLVHQQDVIHAIEHIINREIWGEILHLSAQAHPTRKEYYSWASKQLALTPPVFSEEQKACSGKRLNPEYTLRKLDMQLNYPSPYDML
ncbi:dTDP-4-dehydrorhamnose reductase [Paraglaciecola sp. T6c]|uniref:sugar nucleotide-binding protein n=1 Tax=Pseudoalteromonas atlantica (strain T6c / ATCC BAA-1087) TaxID=3042615 RepID=UPI00005C6449|nr:sugar nucleotide-binding protein [Paraglaciecola sp. T6c]ABG42558.1 dTDP-4-dehydrorhamnose reductase [Paraglaciecola sp. T6c]